MSTAAAPSTAAPVALAAIGLGLSAALGAAVQAPVVTTADAAIQRFVLVHQSPAAHGLFTCITVAGGLTGMRALALVAAALLWRRTRPAAAVLTLAVPFVTELLCDLAKRAYARPRPLGLGQGVDATYAFPSAHAAVSAATCAAIGYVCWRYHVAPRTLVVAVAAGVPLLVGASRVYLNVHWSSDVLGGWLEGVAVAALAAALLPGTDVTRRGTA